MGQTTKVTRKNRTITVDFHNEATYDQLLDDTQGFVEFVLAFLLALGFQYTFRTPTAEANRIFLIAFSHDRVHKNAVM